MQLLYIVLSYSVPFTVWILLRKKANARALPLIAGIVAYVVISLARGAARVFILEGLRGTHWPFYIVSAFLSGFFEETGRYVVFCNVIPGYRRWSDCAAYSVGHCCTEVVLISYFFENDLTDSILACDSFLTSILFSAALSAMVFSSAHFSESKKLLCASIAVHTIADIIPAMYFLGICSLGEYFIVDRLYLAGVCYLGYRVFLHYRYDADPAERDW